MPERIDDLRDLVYSPDDGGYYVHQYGDRKRTSRIYAVREDALRAVARGTVEWDHLDESPSLDHHPRNAD